MIIEVPFEYFCLLAFKVCLQFENKRVIGMQKLFKYIDTVIFLTLEDYKSGDNPVPGEKWVGDVTVKKMDYYDELLAVVAKSNGLFSFDGDNLSIDRRITIDEIDALIETCDVSTRFLYMSTSSECLNVLGATNIKDIILQYRNAEVDFFDEYMKLIDTPYDEALIGKINIFLLKRMIFISKINTFDKQIVMAFYIWSLNLSEIDDDVYKKLPINYKLYRNSDFYDKDYDMSSLFMARGSFLYEIFAEDNLSDTVIINILGEIFDVKDNMNDEDEMDTESYSCKLDEAIENSFIPHCLEEEMLFQLKYIDRINSFFRDYGYNRELDVAKYRLLFVLDKPDWCLYDGKRFEDILDKAMDSGYREDVIFDKFGKQAKYFITEVFGNKNEDSEVVIVKKLLFVGCYYDMTRDSEIRSILNSYRGDENFWLFSQIILGDDIGYIRRLEG